MGDQPVKSPTETKPISKAEAKKLMRAAKVRLAKQAQKETR
jgi:hypothetical protein